MGHLDGDADPSIVTWIYFVGLADKASSGQQLAFSCGKVAQFALPILWVGWIQRESVRPSPKPSRLGARNRFGVGAVALCPSCTLVCLNRKECSSRRLTDQVQSSGLRNHVLGELRRSWHLLCSRSFGTGRSTTGAGSSIDSWVGGSLVQAAVLSSLAFMAHHVILLGTFFGWSSPLTYLLSASVAIGGLFWAWLYHRLQSIYAPWISHLIVDAGIFFVGYDIVRGSSRWLSLRLRAGR